MHLSPLELRQLALEAIHVNSFQRDEAYRAYTDGSLLRASGNAGGACIIYKGGVEVHRSGHRINDWASSTQGELVGIYAALNYIHDRGHGLVICDSQSALTALCNPVRAKHIAVVRRIHALLNFARQNGREIRFLWIPSHIGLKDHDQVDEFVREIALQPTVTMNVGLSIQVYKSLLACVQGANLTAKVDYERPASVTVRHYDSYVGIKHKYGRYKTQTRLCDVVTARIRMGYRYIWQVANNLDSSFSKCKLCEQPNQHRLEHYICECSVISEFRPEGMHYSDLCTYFIESGILADILLMYPGFANP